MRGCGVLGMVDVVDGGVVVDDHVEKEIRERSEADGIKNQVAEGEGSGEKEKDREGE